MSSLSTAAVQSGDAGDALIAKPPRPAPVHAARNYAALQQTASPNVTTTAQQHTTPGPGGASPYTDYIAPPVGSVSVADAASGHGHGLHVSVPVGFDAHLQSGERSVGGRSMAQQSSLMLEDDDAETFLTEERNCCCGLCGCRSCACGRCLSHTWFLLACCGFVFLSSLPRILTLVDFIVTALIYSLSFAGRSSPSLSFWAFLKDDFENYSFRTSGGSLVILSLVRMLILFWTFAYRFHLHRGAFIVATIVACVSTGFVVLKFALNTNPHLLSLLIWSLGITLAEWFVWMSLRRQRIKNPDLRIDHHHHIEAAQAAALIAEDDLGAGTSAAEASLLEQGSHRHSPSMHPEESPAMLPRTLAADIRPSPSTAASASHKQVSSYQRLEGDEQLVLPPSMVASSPRVGAGARGPSSSSSSSSFSSASLSSSLGSSMLLFPRLGAPAEREVDPRSLADPDSLFIEIDSLVVHYKLSIHGRAIVGRDAERQARAWGAAAREGRDIMSNLAHSHSQSQSHSRASEDEAHDRTPSATEEEPLRGSKSAGSSFSPAVAAASPSFGTPIASAIPASASASAADAPHTFRHPIVLLHGFGSSLFVFRALWPDLSQQCSILLAFDRPGFGLTSRPLKDASGSYGSWIERDEMNPSARGVLREQPNPYTTEYSASLLMKLLSKLGLGAERCVFVGHSTGGSLALRTAIVSPERTLGCFLISPHILTAGFPDLVKSLLATKLGKLITQQLVRSEMGEVALKRAWYDASHIPPEALANYQRVLGVKHQMEALVEVSSASASEKEQDALANLAEHFGALAVPHSKGASAAASASSAVSGADLGPNAPGLLPILLLHGVQDKLLSVSESSKVYRALKSAGANVTLIKINHCGHVPHEEYPTLTLEHLYGFLHDVEEGAAGGARAATHDEDEEH